MRRIKFNMENEKKYSAPSVEKMLAVIELLSKENVGYSINEIARLTDSPVNSVYRVCMVMKEHGYLVNDPGSGHFILGSKFYYIGKAAERYMTLNNVARPVLEKLMRETGESTQLITINDGKAIVRLQAETPNPIRIHVETCSIIHSNCSAGAKSVLAFLDEAEAEKIFLSDNGKYTKATITDYPKMKAELETIRKKLISYDNEECMTGLRCIGAPVFDAEGKVVGGIDVMYPVYRITEKKEREFEPLVMKAAAEISECLGYRGDIFENLN